MAGMVGAASGSKVFSTAISQSPVTEWRYYGNNNYRAMVLYINHHCNCQILFILRGTWACQHKKITLKDTKLISHF